MVWEDGGRETPSYPIVSDTEVVSRLCREAGWIRRTVAYRECTWRD